MKTANQILKYQTKGEFEFIDLTGEVKKFVLESRIKNGLINVQSFHTTAALILNENEPLLLEDIKKNLERIAPKTETYLHDDFSQRTVNLCKDEYSNGHSHCKAIRLSANLTLNLINGKIQIGRWQSILFLELDRAWPRQVQIQIIGK